MLMECCDPMLPAGAALLQVVAGQTAALALKRVKRSAVRKVCARACTDAQSRIRKQLGT